jgi:hypothetical protein
MRDKRDLELAENDSGIDPTSGIGGIRTERLDEEERWRRYKADVL